MDKHYDKKENKKLVHLQKVKVRYAYNLESKMRHAVEDSG